jgi:hypothetical protein
MQSGFAVPENSRRIVSRLASIRFWIVRSPMRSWYAMTVKLAPVEAICSTGEQHIRHVEVIAQAAPGNPARPAFFLAPGHPALSRSASADSIAASHGRYAAFQLDGAAISRYPVCRHPAANRGTATASGSPFDVKRLIVLRPVKTKGESR